MLNVIAIQSVNDQNHMITNFPEVYNMYLLLLFMFTVLSLTNGQDNMEAIQNGLAVADSLAAAMQSGDFGKSMSKLATSIGPYLGAIGPAIGIIMAFTSQKDPQIEFMKEMLKRIENRFDKVDQQFKQLTNQVNWNKYEIRLSEHESTIRTLSKNLDRIYRASNNIKQGEINSFLRYYNANWENDPEILMTYTTGTGVFHENLMNVFKTYTENHRGKVQTFMLGLTDLILRGVSVELAYLEFANETAAYKNVRKRHWTNEVKKLRSFLSSVDRSLSRSKVYLPQMKKDIDKLLVNNKGVKDSDFATIAFDFLMEKYNWRDWFVVSYDDISGGSKHWVRVCSGTIKFRNQGRNVVIASVPRSRSPILKDKKSKAAAEKIFDDLKIFNSKKSFPFFFFKGAEDTYKLFPSTVREKCSPYAASGVIMNKSKPQYKAPSLRLLRRQSPFFTVHLFG